jgi:prevent-host-death family protein
MKVMPARKAKNAFGLLIDTARAEPVTIEKHGRPVAVVLSIEEYERLNGRADGPGSERRAVAVTRAANSPRSRLFRRASS